jgi:hypothetical protein
MRPTTLAVTLAMTALSLSFATAAAADPIQGDDAGQVASEHRVPFDQQPFNVAANRCGFPVRVTIVAGNEYIVSSTVAPDGTTTERVTGRLVETLTNTTTGHSITLNVSGPFTVQLQPNGAPVFVDAQGQNVSFFSPASQLKFNVPGILYSTGRLVRQFQNGVLQSVSLSGNATNVCPLIA